MAETDNLPSEDVSMRDASPSVQNEVEEMDVDREDNQDGMVNQDADFSTSLFPG